MNFFVKQTIHINMIKINSISSSSVFQIGAAGMIKPISQFANSGGFTEPAPPAEFPGAGPLNTSTD